MAKKTNISYNEAIREIEEIIARIDHQELDVDDLTECVARVSALLKVCKDKLHATESEVSNILKQIKESESE